MSGGFLNVPTLHTVLEELRARILELQARPIACGTVSRWGSANSPCLHLTWFGIGYRIQSHFFVCPCLV